MKRTILEVEAPLYSRLNAGDLMLTTVRLASSSPSNGDLEGDVFQSALTHRLTEHRETTGVQERDGHRGHALVTLEEEGRPPAEIAEDTPYEELLIQWMKRGGRSGFVVRRGSCVRGVIPAHVLETLSDHPPRLVDVAPLRRDRRLARILDRLHGLAEDQGLILYLVGGVVRDLILGRPPRDVDIGIRAAPALFWRFLDRLESEGDVHVTRHPPFMTATADFEGHPPIDIIASRTETYEAPGALPVVRPGTWLDDLFRRDFTVNALALVLDRGDRGWLFDPLGGERDLRARILRVHHAASFVDDPTRLYRAIRFGIRLGATFSSGTRRAMQDAVRGDAVQRLSGRRLWGEFRAIFEEDQALDMLILMERYDLLRAAGLPSPGARASTFGHIRDALARLRADLGKHPWPPGPDALAELRLACLLVDSTPGERASILRRLDLEGRVYHRLLRTLDGLADARACFERDVFKASEGVRALEALGPNAWVLLDAEWEADSEALRGGTDARIHMIRTRLTRALTHDRLIRSPLGGRDLIALGIPPGPHMKSILERLRAECIDGELDPDDARKRAQALWRDHGPSDEGRT